MKILVIEDDRAVAKSIKKALETLGNIDCAFDGLDGLDYASQGIYDCIILDIMLPSMDGFEILSKIRKTIMAPVLMLTARGQVDDKVKALKSGADDYLVKPFFNEELVARVEALCRRFNKSFDKMSLSFLDLKLNLTNHTCTIKDEEVELSGKLFDILEYLISHIDMIITKEQMFNRVWGFDSETATNVVEVYVSNLRKILKPYDYHIYIQTIRNVGYIFSEKVNGRL